MPIQSTITCKYGYAHVMSQTVHPHKAIVQHDTVNDGSVCNIIGTKAIKLVNY